MSGMVGGGIVRCKPRGFEWYSLPVRLWLLPGLWSPTIWLLLRLRLNLL